MSVGGKRVTMVLGGNVARPFLFSLLIFLFSFGNYKSRQHTT